MGLMAASTALSMHQQNQQYHAQKAQYEAQAQAAKWNQAAEEHKASQIADNYAQKQHQLNDRFKLAVGNARAQFGASGLDSQGGSLEDVLDSSMDAYQRDSQNLLSNQREDTWASYVKQVNYMNEQNAYNQMKHNLKRQRNIGYIGTLLNGASSIYGQGYKEGVWGNSSPKTTSTPFIGADVNKVYY